MICKVIRTGPEEEPTICLRGPQCQSSHVTVAVVMSSKTARPLLYRQHLNIVPVIQVKRVVYLTKSLRNCYHTSVTHTHTHTGQTI